MTNILIVDDDPAVRAGLALLVRACGWVPHPFESGEALLLAMQRDSVLREQSVCMLLDLQLPGLMLVCLCPLLYGSGENSDNLIQDYRDGGIREESRGHVIC